MGAVYALAGLGFGALPARAWRLAAWLVSAVVFTAHIWYEHRRQQTSVPFTAWRAALAAACGAFGLALGAVIHAVSASQHFPAIMLLIWPLMTAVPAFVVALVVTAGLARLPPSASTR